MVVSVSKYKYKESNSYSLGLIQEHNYARKIDCIGYPILRA